MVDFPRPAASDRGVSQLWGQPLIVEPTAAQHTATLILLHGFSSTPHALHDRWLPGLRERLSDGFSYDSLEGVRFVLPPAPVREISCYGTADRPRYPAWHDYRTADRAASGAEEELDLATLEETREQLHELLDVEIAALGGDASRVVLGGHSQGGCVAMDAAITYHKTLGGVLVSRGHLYSATPLALEPCRCELRILHWHGTCDGSIAPSLASAGWATLLQRGFRKLHAVLDPNTTTGAHSALPAPACSRHVSLLRWLSRDASPHLLLAGHAELPCAPAELDEFASALRKWGLIPAEGVEAADFFTRDVNTRPLGQLSRRAGGPV
jgi:predicted esterase